MDCPRCQTRLREREREMSAGDVVVMDACPACGGIWLDKGELEKLTRLEDRYYEGRSGRDGRRDDDDDDDDGFGGFGGGGRAGGRRGGFLGGLFEGFGND